MPRGSSRSYSKLSPRTFYRPHQLPLGLRGCSAIWRSESRISSRYLEITSISLIYSLTFSRKKELLFWLSRGLWPIRSEETLSWGISRLHYCDPRWFGIWKLVMKWSTSLGTRLGEQVLDFSACFIYFTKWDQTTSWYLEITSSLVFNYSRNKQRIFRGRAETRNFSSSVEKHFTSEPSFRTVLWWI